MNSEIIIIKKLIDRLLRAWPILIIGAGAWSVLAILVTLISPVFYESTVSVVVQEPYRMDDPQRWILGEQRFNEPERSHVVNEGVRIKEFSLVLRTVEALNLGVKYLEQGVLVDREIYRTSPIQVKVESLGEKNLTPNGIAFYISILNEERFALSVDDEFGAEDTPIALDIEANFGETIQLAGTSVRILRNEQNAFEDGVTYGFELVNTTELALDLAEDLDVESVELEASIFKASLTAAPAGKAEDILHTLAELFVAEKLEERRGILRTTLGTINEQMTQLGEQLAKQEGDIEQYKSTSEINSAEEQGRMLLEEINQLESQLVELNSRDKYMSYLEKGVTAPGDQRPSLVAPSAYGVSDPALNQLVSEYNNLLIAQSTLVSENRTGHPAFEHTETQLKAKAGVIRETIKGFRLSNSILIENTQSQLEGLRKRSSALPFEQMELLRKDRAFNTLDLNYRALNQRKMEVEIAIASLTADVSVVEEAHDTTVEPKFPDPVLIAIFLFLLTVLSPFVYLFLVTLLGHSIKDLDELKALLQHTNSTVHTVSTSRISGRETEAMQAHSIAIKDAKAVATELISTEQKSEGKVITALYWNNEDFANRQVDLLIVPLNRMKVKTLVLRMTSAPQGQQIGYTDFMDSLRSTNNLDIKRYDAQIADSVTSITLNWSLEDRVTTDDKHTLESLLSTFQLVVLQLPSLEENSDAAALADLGSEALLFLEFGRTDASSFLSLQSAATAVERQRVILGDAPPPRLNLRVARNLLRYEGLSLRSILRMLIVRI